MISYQPAYDPYHASFRILRLVFVLRGCLPLPVEKIRILDFFLLFPFLLDGIRVRPQDRSIKNVARSYSNFKPFAELPEPRVLFGQMEVFQVTALESLEKKNWITIVDFQVQLGGGVDNMSAELRKRISDINSTDEKLMEAIQKLGCDYDLLGKDGLKHRTNLMEFRYDAV